MKNLKTLCLLLAFSLSIQSKSSAAEVESVGKELGAMEITKRPIDFASDIINGDFNNSINYLEVLPSPKSQDRNDEEISPSMIAYVYQVLGQHYMMENNVSEAAESYCRSLEYYPDNYELTFYLNALGVTNFLNKNNIESALKKIVRK